MMNKGLLIVGWCLVTLLGILANEQNQIARHQREALENHFPKATYHHASQTLIVPYSEHTLTVIINKWPVHLIPLKKIRMTGNKPRRYDVKITGNSLRRIPEKEPHPEDWSTAR